MTATAFNIKGLKLILFGLSFSQIILVGGEVYTFCDSF